jgi:hypothetical protein
LAHGQKKFDSRSGEGGGKERDHATDGEPLPLPSLPLNRYTVFKDHITLEDYEIHDGMGLELYYN